MFLHFVLVIFLHFVILYPLQLQAFLMHQNSKTSMPLKEGVSTISECSLLYNSKSVAYCKLKANEFSLLDREHVSIQPKLY